MDDFRQNSPPWRDDDGACSVGLLVAHALLFSVQQPRYVCLYNAM